MSLDSYFTSLIERVENSDIGNGGKDKSGFFEPTRAVLLQRLSMLKDLHSKPQAKPMLKSAWQYVVEHVPAEWLVLEEDDKRELKRILS